MTIRSIDALELSIRAMTLHPKDIIVIRVENTPTIGQMQTIQQGIANLMSSLDLGFSVSYIVLPHAMRLEQLNDEDMARGGWVRSVEPLPQKELV